MLQVYACQTIKRIILVTVQELVYTVRILNLTIQNLEIFKIQTIKVCYSLVPLFCLNGPVFRGSGYSFSTSYGLNHLKTLTFKLRTFLFGFPMVLVKWLPFVWISNSWASIFQIPFEIQTICKPTSY